MKTCHACILSLASLLALQARGLGQCVPNWQSFNPQTGIGNADVRALLSVEGGPLPVGLYAGGTFTTMGSLPTSGIARWDGGSWYPVGGGMGGVLPWVYCLALFDDDGPGPHAPALYAGGSFNIAGGSNVNFLAKWDGNQWSSVGGGPGNWVTSLAVFDDDGPGPHLPALYAGGYFTVAGAGAGEHIARWDGSSWSQLGPGLSSQDPLTQVDSLAVFDDDGPGPHLPALYAGGYFVSAGTLTVNGIARWDGASWSGLGSGTELYGNLGIVRALATFDPDGAGPAPEALYAGGGFTSISGVTASGLAAWNGSAWSVPGGGLDSDLYALAKFDDDGSGPHAEQLAAVGRITSAGGQPAQDFAFFDGASWSAPSSGIGDMPEAAASWDSDGAGPARPGFFVGGNFTSAGGLTSPISNRIGIAEWNGSQWALLGGGLGYGDSGYYSSYFSWIGASAVFDEDGPGPAAAALIVAGDFSSVGNVPAEDIARWDGAHWSAVGTGLTSGSGWIWSLKVLDEDGPGPMPPALYAAGAFVMGGHYVSVARWDGTSWTALGNGQIGGSGYGTFDLVAFDDDGPGPHPTALYASGLYGTSVVAKWDGTAWSLLPGTFAHASGYPAGLCLAVFDEDGGGPRPASLIVGGMFDTIDQNPCSSIARWDGTSWTALGGGLQGTILPGYYQDVESLCVFDEDGPGPISTALFVGGWFTSAGGNLSAGFAAWDGSAWWYTDTSSAPPIWKMCVLDEDGAGTHTPTLYLAPTIHPAFGPFTSALATYSLSGSFLPSVGIGSNPCTTEQVMTLTPFDDDGAGPHPPGLFVGGAFASVGSLPTASMALLHACGNSVSSFCFGDGSAAPCPCGNSGAAGRGCANSAGPGAQLSASGSASLGADSLVLTCTGTTSTATSVFLGGRTAIAPVPFGDGLRCLGGGTQRLYIRSAIGGSVSAPQAGDPTFSARAATAADPLAPGYTRQYQVFYRDDSPTFCPAPSGSVYNISNGLQVVWSP